MAFSTGSSPLKSLSFSEKDDVKQFVEYLERQLSTMEQAGWFPTENRMRGWVVELRRGSMEREILGGSAWRNAY